MNKSPESGFGARVPVAGFERGLTRRRLPFFQNPVSVLMLGVFLLGIVIIVMTEVAIRDQTDAATRTAELRANTLSISMRDQIGIEIAALDSTLRIASVVARQDGLDVAAVRVARMIAARAGTPAVFFLLDARGKELWKSGAFTLDPATVSEHMAASSNYTGTPYISAARHHADSGVWGMYLSLPVLDANGTLMGLALAVLDAARFQQSYNSMNLGLGGLLQLIRNDGTVMAQIAQGDLSAGAKADAAIWSQIATQAGRPCKNIVTAGSADSSRRISSFCNIESYPLVVGVGISHAAAVGYLEADVWRDRAVAILLIAILAVGAMVLRLLLARQRRTEADLRHSEARFRAVFEQASVGIGVREISMAPRWIGVNRKLCEILGYSESELLQMTTVELTPEEDRSETQDYNVKLRSGELRSYTRQKRYRRKDGRIIWVDLSVAIVGGADSESHYLVSVVHDISDAVAARELLKESEERYRQIFALTPLPMFLRSETTRQFLDLNNACLETYGYTRDEFLSLTVADLQVPEERGDDFDPAGARAGSVVERLKKKHVRKGGELFDVEIYSYPATLGAEQVRLTLVRDMTEQIRTEQQLRDSERRIALALAASGGALFDWDVVTAEVYLSESWNVMLGGESRETHTTFPELTRLLHPDDQEEQRAAVVRLLKTGSAPLLTEYRVRNLRGDWIWIESRGSVTERSKDGRALRIRGTNVDVTLRKQVELALRERDARLRESEIEIRKLNADLERRVEQRTQALAAANRELEAFSYSVSHDLRAPLRTIDGFSQIVLDEYAAKLDDTGRGYLERVRAGSQRMARLIDDLLELARITRRELQVRQCDLTATVNEIVQELRNAEPERNVRVVVAEGMQAAADPGLLRVVLDNLLRNAWKFTSREAKAVIEIGLAHTDRATGPTFFVRDNGVGFDMTYVGKLFGAFQRLHTEAEFQGTGIGLALVQRVIRRHGGEVWAEAAPGRGATFYFTLPAVAAAGQVRRSLRAGT